MIAGAGVCCLCRAILGAAFSLAVPPADAAACPVLPWLAQRCGFPEEVLKAQAETVLRFVLRS